MDRENVFGEGAVCRKKEDAEGNLTIMKKQLYGASEVSASIRRMAEAICREFSGGEGDLALVGIHKLGVPLAKMLEREIAAISGKHPEFGTLDITMYRDDFGDFSRLPAIQETEIPFDVNGRKLILVDDVFSSGRTIRAALDALTDFGRPGMIRLAVLVDRGEPEFPIRPDFAGFSLKVPSDHKIRLCFDPELEIYEIPTAEERAAVGNETSTPLK